MKRFAWVIGATLLAGFCVAQQPFRQALQQMKLEQKLGNQVPGTARFKNEQGQDIQFASILGKRPVVLLPIFFTCTGMCGKETDNLLKTIVRLEDRQVGKDYDVVFLSIKPTETPDLALNKKTSLLKIVKGDTNEEGFHFLTGQLDEIRKVTDSVGFGFAYDPKDDRINHPAGLMVLSSSGKIVQYMTSTEYPPKEFAAALDLAKKNVVGKEAETMLLGCVMIDPVTGKKSLVIENVVRLAAGVFALGLFSWIGAMVVKSRRTSDTNGGTPTSA